MEIVIEGPAKNALGTTLLTHIRDKLESAGEEPVMLVGSGDAFSAGLNLKEVISLNHETMGTFLSLLQEVVFRLFHHPGPTVACVNGHAIAGGAVLARACDRAVATTQPKAKIGLNEVAIGLQFPPRLVAMVSARVSRRHHAEVFLGATLFSPQDAQRVGLVDELADDPRAVAEQWLERLGAHPRAAYASAKHSLQGHVGQPDPERDRQFLEQVIPAWTSEDLRDRIGRFLKS